MDYTRDLRLMHKEDSNHCYWLGNSLDIGKGPLLVMMTILLMMMMRLLCLCSCYCCRSEFLSEYMDKKEFSLPELVSEHDKTLEDNPLWDYGLATSPEMQAYMRGELGMPQPSSFQQQH